MSYNNNLFVKKLILAKLELIKEVISDLKYLIIKVSGESMLPTLKDSEKIIISSVLNKNDLQVGDIILFYDFQYILTLHRLIHKDNNKFILKGDNAETVDIIEFNNMLGKVDTNIKLEDLNQKEEKQYIKKIDDYNIVININSRELVSSIFYS